MILLLVVMFSQGDKVSIHSCPLIQGECHSVDIKLLQGAIVWFISFQILSPDLRGALELTLSIRVRSYLIRSFSDMLLFRLVVVAQVAACLDRPDQAFIRGNGWCGET